MRPRFVPFVPLQRFSGYSFPKPMPSSRRDCQGVGDPAQISTSYVYPGIALIIVCAAILSPSIALAQHQKHDVLTDAQVEKIREAGIYPNERIKLYTEYLNDHVNTVKGLTNRAKSDARAVRLDRELQDVADLMDELGSNLDVYSDRHADIRGALKTMVDESPQWLTTLKALAGEEPFDLSRKEAIEAGQDLTDQAQRLLREQTDYFALHKDEKGQERTEPKPAPQ